MHFICPQKTLVHSISIVQKSVSSKTTLPILKGILIEAYGDQLKLIGTDLELSIENIIEATIIKEGAAVIESRLFSEIIRKLPDGNVEIQLLDNNQIMIKCAHTEFNIGGYSASDFPEMTQVEEDHTYKISQELFKDMIRKTAFAASQDDSKPIFTGVLLEIENHQLNMVALDGYRLAIRKGLIDSSDSHRIVVPAKMLLEISRITNPDDDNPIYITFSESNALFTIGNTKLTTRLLNGEFLSYNQILPKVYHSKIKVNTENMLDSIERASLLGKEGKSNLVKFTISENKLVVTSHTELGKVYEEIDIQLEGVDLEIGFNSKYFIDALKVIEEEEIHIEFTNNVGPGIIKPVEEGENQVYLILPVRIPNS